MQPTQVRAREPLCPFLAELIERTLGGHERPFPAQRALPGGDDFGERPKRRAPAPFFWTCGD